MKIPIQNIDTVNKHIFLFLRNPVTKQLEIKSDPNFVPYYYKLDDNGSYTTYDNKKASIVRGQLPRDIKFHKDVYETDVSLSKKYIIDKDIDFLVSPTRYIFFDIEVLTLPNTSIKAGTAPISCITIKDSHKKSPQQFYLGTYLKGNYEEAEKQLLFDFIQTIKLSKPDILLAWHIDFDWSYLCKRQDTIAELISPIGKSRYWHGESSKAPIGISIVDYLTLFKKVNMREANYKLDTICEKYLDAGKVHKEIDFTILSDELKERNREDVVLLNKLEDKLKLLPYYDEIRRLCKVKWEELYYNSKSIEMLCFQEAKKMKLVLPNKRKSNDKVQFQGAIRGMDEAGVFHTISKHDLSSAYPNAIINFCLDEMNLTTEKDKNGININGLFFKQNPDTLIPRVAAKMIGLKNIVGNKLKNLKESDTEYSKIKQQYAGIKGIVNSTFGVLGSEYFRLYNSKVVSSITFLVRDLLGYVQTELKNQGYKVIYHDTDSIFLDCKENPNDLLNELIQEWGKLKYNKDKIDIDFAYEGHFKDLLILGTCHYYGVKDKGGSKPEVKGIEMKRVSSTKFEAKFQEDLIKKVLAGEKKKDIEKWVEEKKEIIKTLPLSEICFPAKIALDKIYKNKPVFIRAIENSKLFDKSFTVKPGDSFYYVYIEKQGKDKNNKNIDVIAFHDDTDTLGLKFKTKIDWDRIIDRNIDKKINKIFEALKWVDTKKIKLKRTNTGLLDGITSPKISKKIKSKINEIF